MNLVNTASERIVISSILNSGSSSYFEVSNLLSPDDFAGHENRIVFECFKRLFEQEKAEKADLLYVLESINSIDKNLAGRYNLVEYLDVLTKDRPTTNLNDFAKVIAKLSLARQLKNKLLEAIAGLEKTTGQESLQEIISQTEKPFIEFNCNVTNVNDVVLLNTQIEDYIGFLASRQNQILGIPTGFPKYDESIGGGLRKPGIHIIGGRAKSGKSMILLNMGHYIASLGIPIIYLDTELSDQITMTRMMAMVSGIDINDLETGRFAKDPEVSYKVQAAIDKIKKNDNFYYYNVAGRHHTEIISIVRKWLLKNVGINNNGHAKDCVVILDYFKTMDLDHAKQFQEYQHLGQMITDYQNFCIKYHLPMLSAVQLNRDGINREDQGTIAGSDRIMALCSSFSILKKKSEEDFADDPIVNGDRKLIVVDCRFGPALDSGEYINVKSNLSKARMIEANLNTENRIGN